MSTPPMGCSEEGGAGHLQTPRLLCGKLRPLLGKISLLQEGSEEVVTAILLHPSRITLLLCPPEERKAAY